MITTTELAVECGALVTDLNSYKSMFQFTLTQLETFTDIITKQKDEEILKLRTAIINTLDENGHLADGDNCTLIHLKRAIGME